MDKAKKQELRNLINALRKQIDLTRKQETDRGKYMGLKKVLDELDRAIGMLDGLD